MLTNEHKVNRVQSAKFLCHYKLEGEDFLDRISHKIWDVHHRSKNKRQSMQENHTGFHSTKNSKKNIATLF